ncbi:hypothetical protein Dimus_030481 [Dionaea muscipula]
MVGRRSLSQRRIVEDVYDSQSPEPGRRLLFRGSPSPTPPRHRRPALSPGTRPRYCRSPSPLLRTSSDPDEFSSSEEGEASEVVVTSSEAEDHSDGEERKPIPCPVIDLSLVVEEDEDRLESDGEGGGAQFLMCSQSDFGDGVRFELSLKPME